MDPDEAQEYERMNALARHWVKGHEEDETDLDCDVCGYLSFALDALEEADE